jgi:hypothetical protein
MLRCVEGGVRRRAHTSATAQSLLKKSLMKAEQVETGRSLRSAKLLQSHWLRARDGVFGQVKDFYFDDHHWRIRYFVVETGQWLQSRKVLISPAVLGAYDPQRGLFPVDLTMDQVRHSPDVDTELPVSRQQEDALQLYYGWPGYWSGVMGAGSISPIMVPPVPAVNLPPTSRGPQKSADPHLRSTTELIGYRIEAVDGAIGHVDDFLLDDESWRIRYLVVDTRNWWPGKKVVVAPTWIRDVSWEKLKVVIDLTKESIKGGPPYEPSQPWSPEYAARLHDYYGRPRDPTNDPFARGTKRPGR